MITRRNFIGAGVALALATANDGRTASAEGSFVGADNAAAMADPWTNGGMGLAETSLAVRLGGYGHTAGPLRDNSIAYLEYCHSLGAIGVQMSVKGDLGAFRKRAEALNMFIEYQGRLPDKPGGDLSEIERSMEEAKTVGATTMRVVSTGRRRYEFFKTLADFRETEKNHRAVVEEIVPLAEKHKIILAMENHKDRTADEFVALLKQFSSEYYGALIDFGNNLSLSEEPMSVVRKLAPYVKSTHLKDMAVKRYEEGFLLSEVTCGRGFLNMKGMVEICRRANPKVRICLEMITDHVLKVPVNTDMYWVTFPERRAEALPAILKLVDTHASQEMPQTAQLSEGELLAREEENNRRSLLWGRDNLAVSWLA